MGGNVLIGLDVGGDAAVSFHEITYGTGRGYILSAKRMIICSVSTVSIRPHTKTHLGHKWSYSYPMPHFGQSGFAAE